MLNHITIMGRLTRDPELRYTQSGIAVASFTVAVDRDYTQGGERGVDFIDCVAWRQGGEFVCKYFSKGQMIVVDGRLESRKWQDRDGNNRTGWEINCNHTYFGEPKRDDNQQYGGYQQQAPQGGYQGQQQIHSQGRGQQYPHQQQGFQTAGEPRNVYPGPEMNELYGDDPDNPFTGAEGQARQVQTYGGRQVGMWDQMNAEADGELPF